MGEGAGDDHRDGQSHEMPRSLPSYAGPRTVLAAYHRADGADRHGEPGSRAADEHGHPQRVVEWRRRADRPEGEGHEERAGRVPVEGVGDQLAEHGDDCGTPDQRPRCRADLGDECRGEHRGGQRDAGAYLRHRPRCMHPVASVERGEGPERGVERPFGPVERQAREQRYADAHPGAQGDTVGAGSRMQAQELEGARTGLRGRHRSILTGARMWAPPSPT